MEGRPPLKYNPIPRLPCTVPGVYKVAGMLLRRGYAQMLLVALALLLPLMAISLVLQWVMEGALMAFTITLPLPILLFTFLVEPLFQSSACLIMTAGMEGIAAPRFDKAIGYAFKEGLKKVYSTRLVMLLSFIAVWFLLSRSPVFSYIYLPFIYAEETTTATAMAFQIFSAVGSIYLAMVIYLLHEIVSKMSYPLLYWARLKGFAALRMCYSLAYKRWAHSLGVLAIAACVLLVPVVGVGMLVMLGITLPNLALIALFYLALILVMPLFAAVRGAFIVDLTRY